MLTTIGEGYLEAARTTVELLRDPAVTQAWDKPSALREFSVRGLAGHLGLQVSYVSQLLATDPPAERPLSLAEFYGAAEAFATDIDSDINVRIRQQGEDSVHQGPEKFAAEVESALAEQRGRLPTEPAGRVVSFLARPILLEDFLCTRMMEIAVHADDLAVSVGIPTPQLPPSVTEPVLALLCELAVLRHGQTAVLRALSRAERAPSTIAGI